MLTPEAGCGSFYLVYLYLRIDGSPTRFPFSHVVSTTGTSHAFRLSLLLLLFIHAASLRWYGRARLYPIICPSFISASPN